MDKCKFKDLNPPMTYVRVDNVYFFGNKCTSCFVWFVGLFLPGHLKFNFPESPVIW